MAEKYSVENRYICYDSDGVGSYIDGFIKNSIPFNGGGAVMATKDRASGRMIKENYMNLKTQCYYRMGDRVNRYEVKINEKVFNRMYNSEMTVRQRFLLERKAIRRDKIDMEGKLRIIPKEEMKVKLSGESPDLLDMFMMREIFELKPKVIFAYADN